MNIKTQKLNSNILAGNGSKSPKDSNNSPRGTGLNLFDKRATLGHSLSNGPMSRLRAVANKLLRLLGIRHQTINQQN